jgi:hypothetical protein
VETIVHNLDVDFGTLVVMSLGGAGVHHDFKVPQETRTSWVGARKQ